jgi:hypothetical protein
MDSFQYRQFQIGRAAWNVDIASATGQRRRHAAYN